MKCPQTTRSISLTYCCPVGGLRFQVWDHIPLATVIAPRSVLALALVASIPGHDCELHTNPLHSLILTYLAPGWLLQTRVLQTLYVVWCCAGSDRFLGCWLELQTFKPHPMGLRSGSGVCGCTRFPGDSNKQPGLRTQLNDATSTWGCREAPGPLRTASRRLFSK